MTSLPLQSISSSSFSQTYPLVKKKVQHIINSSTMLCCGRKKDSRSTNQRIVGEGSGMRYMTHPGYPCYPDGLDGSGGAIIGGPPLRRAVHFPVSAYSFHSGDTDGSRHPDMVIQGDFRKVSGITSEIFRQIEAVEREYDATTAAHMEAAEKRGEMLIRLLDPRCLGKAGAEVARKYLNTASSMDGSTSVQFVEIVKRPGQTLGLYIREGDGFRSSEGVFISRIALESPVYNSGLLKVGDEILAVNLVDVRRMSLDDVVIIMSIPRRLVLTIRSRAGRLGPHGAGPLGGMLPGGRRLYEGEEYRQPPVVVFKKEFGDEEYGTDDMSSNRDDENGHLLSARLKGLPGSSLPIQPLSHFQNEGDIYSDGSPYGYARRGLPPPSRPPTSMMGPRDDSWSGSGANRLDATSRSSKPPFPGSLVPGSASGVGLSSINQPLGFQRLPRTMDSLNQIYSSGYSSEVPYSSLSRGGLPGRSPMMSRSLIERNSPSRSGSRFLNDDYGSLRRNTRLLRTESDNSINPLSREYGPHPLPGDPYMRPQSRTINRPMTSTDYHNSLVTLQKRSNEIRSSLSTHGLSSILRRRGPATDGSVSDTEVGGMSRPPVHFRHDQHRAGRYGGSSRDNYQWKSSSLPRQRGSGLTSDYRYNRSSGNSGGGIRRSHRGGQSVRFERNNAYANSVYDDDSDGALSAPELPEARTKRLMGRRSISSNNRFSQDEYKQWMTRAPSTSAIYETLRRPGQSSGLPSGLSSTSLSRIAHSAESLLDTIRTEQQKSMLENLYATRPGLASDRSPQLPSSLLKPDLSNDSISTIGLPHPLRTRPLIPAATATAVVGVKSVTAVVGPVAPASLLPSALASDHLRTIPNPTPVKASEEERLHLLTLNPREFFKYRYEKPPTNENESSTSTNRPETEPVSNNGSDINQDESRKSTGFNGILWIHLLAGRGLRSGSVPTNHRDLYCVIECDRVHKARTVIRSGESSFDWDEIFELDLFESREISFLLYSWDPQYRHKLCYKGSINLIGLSLAETPVHSLALKMEPKGTLYIKIRYKDISISYQRTPLSPTTASANAVFGLSLETLVNRENSGLSVPLIVKRCTQEVEKRGLHLVGIYRLCGSAVRKKILREAFEKNSWLVDLSAEHVPDINVITSLLKDYIRELPEPLFTKALFDMMVDGLSVCLPDDPPGNAKLMFSILECLPKINRSTVLFLMDHLKLVESQNERNKMNSQALAVAFGPLFTASSESESLRKPIEVFKFLLEIWPPRGSTTQSNNEDPSLNGKPNNQTGSGTTSTLLGHHQSQLNQADKMTSAAIGTSGASSTSTSSTIVGINSSTYVTTRDVYPNHQSLQQQSQQSQQSSASSKLHQLHNQRRSSFSDDTLGIPSLTPGPSPTQLIERLSPDSSPTREVTTTSSSLVITSSTLTTTSGSTTYSSEISYSSTNPFRSDLRSSAADHHHHPSLSHYSSPASHQQSLISNSARETREGREAKEMRDGGFTGITNNSNGSGPGDRATAIKKSVAWAASTRNNQDASSDINSNNRTNYSLSTSSTASANVTSTSKDPNIGSMVTTTSTSSSLRDRYADLINDSQRSYTSSHGPASGS